MSRELTKTSRLRLGPGLAGVHLTPDEFDRARATRGYRYELIGGVVVVSPHPRNDEVVPNQYLGHLLYRYEEEHALGKVLDVSLPEQTIPFGDDRRLIARAIWTCLGRTPDLETDVPTIAVDFVSRAKRDFLQDFIQKRDEYLKLGVREYWIIDRHRRTMNVHRGEGDRVTTKAIVEAETHRTDLLPGFVLPLAELLKLADDWAPAAKLRGSRKPGTPPAEDA
jgi:Uma2 family endonuclease